MIILLDQDGVLADFDLGFYQGWQKKYPDRAVVPIEKRSTFIVSEDYPLEWKADVESIYTVPGFISQLPPIEGSIEAYHELLRLGFDVRICTSPLMQYQNNVTEKFQWVERHLGKAAIERLILTRDKTFVFGDILIDDKPVITGARSPNWRHVTFDAPYNRHIDNPYRVTWHNWREVLAGLLYQQFDF